MVIIPVPIFRRNSCPVHNKGRPGFGSTTVWPNLHLLLRSSITHFEILNWTTNTWSDTTPLHDKSFRRVITSNSSKHHRYLQNVISYRRYCEDTAKILRWYCDATKDTAMMLRYYRRYCEDTAVILRCYQRYCDDAAMLAKILRWYCDATKDTTMILRCYRRYCEDTAVILRCYRRYCDDIPFANIIVSECVSKPQ